MDAAGIARTPDEPLIAPRTERRFFVRGEVDIANAPDLLFELHQAIATNADDLVVDCCGLTFIDSSGLAALIQAEKTLEQLGRQFRVVNVDRKTARLFDVMGLSETLHVEDHAS